jgi:hypothetical protein
MNVWIYYDQAGQDSPELQRSINMLSNTKEKVGNDVYQRLKEIFERR